MDNYQVAFEKMIELPEEVYRHRQWKKGLRRAILFPQRNVFNKVLDKNIVGSTLMIQHFVGVDFYNQDTVKEI